MIIEEVKTMAVENFEKNNWSESKIFRALAGDCPMRALRAELKDKVKAVLEFASRGNLASDWGGEYFDFNPDADIYSPAVLPLVERAYFMPLEISGERWKDIFGFLVEKIDPIVREYWSRLDEIEEDFDEDSTTSSFRSSTKSKKRSRKDSLGRRIFGSSFFTQTMKLFFAPSGVLFSSRRPKKEWRF